MWATPSPPDGRSRWVFAAWLVFSALSVASMSVWPRFGAVGFHFVWISLALVYGVQGWSSRRIAVVLSGVVVVTTLAMAGWINMTSSEWPELTEVPLMAGVFLTMVWHVRRRAAALAETQAAAERERRAQEVKELFVRNCSHEMRTPITVARGYAEMVRGTVADRASKDDLDVVVDELDKLGGLAGRLVVLADAYESEQFEWAPVDLGALVERTVQRWRPAADRAWTFEAVPVVIEADESRLEAALDALIENAVKFTLDGDSVVLRARSTRTGAMIEVEDSGIGFAQSRADDGAGPPRSSGRPGTGLGLAIVAAVAEGHGGELVVVEDRPRGALVRMSLPRHGSVAGHARSADPAERDTS